MWKPISWVAVFELPEGNFFIWNMHSKDGCFKETRGFLSQAAVYTTAVTLLHVRNQNPVIGKKIVLFFIMTNLQGMVYKFLLSKCLFVWQNRQIESDWEVWCAYPVFVLVAHRYFFIFINVFREGPRSNIRLGLHNGALSP